MISGSHNTHARFSPSSAHMWTKCTAAVAYTFANSHRVPPDRSKYADEGTEAHDHAANVLLGNTSIEDVPEDFRPHIAAYVDHCMSLVPDGVKPMVETKVPLFYQPSENGTCDFAVVTDRLIVIRDLKYGAGVLVHGEENEQLGIYALSLIAALDDPDFPISDDAEVNIAPFQPRHHEAQDSRPWITTVRDLRAWGTTAVEYPFIQASTGLERVQAKLPCGERDIQPDEILEAAPMLRFAPGEGDEGACRWCKARSFCPERFSASAEPVELVVHDPTAALDMLPNLDEPASLSRLTDEDLVRIYSARKHVAAFMSGIEEYLEGRALAGNPAPGTKLVPGREGNRAWTNESAADKFLAGQGVKSDSRYTRKLISPSQSEKLLKNLGPRALKRFSELVTRSAPKPVLALAEDPRPAVGCAVDVLPNLETEEPE